MCLYKTHMFPKISRKPIQVYKVFRLEGDKLITPYQEQSCKVGETIKAKYSWIKGVLKNKIEGEGVHAFVSKCDADCLAVFGWFYRVYLCEIPPFTPYWIDDDDDEIAASKMIIKKEVFSLKDRKLIYPKN